MGDYLVFRVREMTCTGCGESQRVRIRLVGEVEVMPGCVSCGRTDGWMSLPTLAEPRPELPAPTRALGSGRWG